MAKRMHAMRKTSSLLSKRVLLAGVALIAFSTLGAPPSFAVEELAAAAPSSENALTMAPSPGSDPLANFGPSSGTVVGNRALELRDEVVRLRSSVNLNSNQFTVLHADGVAGSVQYHSTVSAITARLQNGTTRGNPILLRQWEEANTSLDESTTSLDKLNALLTAINGDASVASYLMQSIQAGFELSGAVDEDHDQLKFLRDEVSRLTVQIDLIRSQTMGDLTRDTSYLSAERTNLQSLAFAISRGELIDNTAQNRSVIATNPVPILPPQMPHAAPVAPVTQTAVDNAVPVLSPATAQAQAPAAAASAAAEAYAGAVPTVGRLLVLIRYNQPVVNYEQQLSQAVGSVVERQPDAKFSIVAVSPASGDPADVAKSREDAERNAESVKRSLIQLGLPVSSISTANTQTQSAQVPEVHVYVR
jgi:hypothetical protein